jgi:hypothetical protein
MNDWIPTLPSFQTWLSIFCSQKFVEANGADIAKLVIVTFYIVVNAIISIPFVGPSWKVRWIIYMFLDFPLVLAINHFLLAGWDYSPQEIQQITQTYQTLNVDSNSADERAYRSSMLWQVATASAWNKTPEQMDSIRKDILASLPAYYKTRDARRAQLEKDYADWGFLGWWSYRYGIDVLDTELPPGLEEQTNYSPRAARAMDYGCTLIALAIFTLPYHRRLLYVLRPASSPKSLIHAENERLTQDFAAYDHVEMLNGNITFSAAYKGSFTYKAGSIYMGDVKLVVIGGEWLTQGEETGEYLAPSGVTLRFTRRIAQHQSVFDQ